MGNITNLHLNIFVNNLIDQALIVWDGLAGRKVARLETPHEGNIFSVVCIRVYIFLYLCTHVFMRFCQCDYVLMCFCIYVFLVSLLI